MSGFYIGVDGKARKIKGGYIGIDGVARKIKKGYIGDENGIARLCWSDFDGDPVFANNTWEKIIETCQNGNVPISWKIGDQKTMSINGKSYAIDIIGKNHDDYTDGSGKAPITFQLHEYYSATKGMYSSSSNSCGWTNSTMRATALADILKAMPSEVKSAVRQVNKFTSAGNKNSTIQSTADKLFLLSEIEVFGTTTKSVVGEGRQYAYYANGGSPDKASGTVVSDWWLRSPAIDSTAQFCTVDENGLLSSRNANVSECVSFAFCF